MATLVQSNLIPYLDIKVNLYIVQTQYPSKSWVFKSYLPIKVRKQQQIKLQCKTPLFSTSLLVLTTFPTMSNNKLFFYFSYFSPLCLFTISSQNYSYTLSTLPSSILHPFFISLFAHTAISIVPTNTLFPYLSHYANSDCVSGRMSDEVFENWDGFNLSLLSQTMESDNSAHNHWFLIAQTKFMHSWK